ncbi:MAG TPA: FAD-dependent oxidoreductase [Solirubrobacteraceae bacterium]|jgi:monoamine oxidase
MRAPGTRSILPLVQDPSTQPDYLPYVRGGLPGPKGGREVAVVGAGMAGLLAATLLAGAGHKVRIFEASRRIGGRIMTVREPFSAGLYGEAGAMRLPSFYELTLAVIAQFGLPTNVFYNHDESGNELIFVNGVKVRRRDYQAQQGRGLGYPLEPAEEGMTAEALLASALAPIASYVGSAPLEDAAHNQWRKVIARYGEQSVREFLKGQTFYSEGAIELIEVLMDLESRSESALIQQIVEINDHGPDVHYAEITGGMDKLTDAFVARLAELEVPIELDRRLIGIERAGESDPVRLDFTAGDPPTSAGSVAADCVIVTVPFPGLRYVTVTPPFSHDKRKAIRELHYDAATKIMLEFSTRFWEIEDEIYGGCTITDLPSRFVYYPSNGWRSGGGGVLITSYTWGDEARGWDSFSHDDQIRFTLDDLATIHGQHIREYFVRGVVQSWATDRFSHGEAAMFYGGQLEELQACIPVPEGQVHFAGEHTSLKHAWIEGSFESAIRAALEVHGHAPGK